jgi:hypothetical protein
MHIDATTGYLYWWNKPDGKVLGAISLADTILTALPAPEFAFRLSRNGRFRDLRADSASNLATWLKHLNEEIAARSSGGAGMSDKTVSASRMPTLSKREGLESSSQLAAANMGERGEEKNNQLGEKNKQLAAEILILKERVKELEMRNAQLEAANAVKGSGDDDKEDVKAAELLKVSFICLFVFFLLKDKNPRR